jgi:hypothetical protein
MSDEKYTGGGLSNLFGKGGRRRRYDQNQDGGEGDLEKMSGGACTNQNGTYLDENNQPCTPPDGGRRRRRKSRKAPKKSRKSRRGRKSRKN